MIFIVLQLAKQFSQARELFNFGLPLESPTWVQSGIWPTNRTTITSAPPGFRCSTTLILVHPGLSDREVPEVLSRVRMTFCTPVDKFRIFTFLSHWSKNQICTLTLQARKNYFSVACTFSLLSGFFLVSPILSCNTSFDEYMFVKVAMPFIQFERHDPLPDMYNLLLFNYTFW